LEKLINDLENDYKNRGINLQSIEKKNFFFKTSEDLSVYLNLQTEKTRNLSQAAMETLAIISYHQPVTRAEIEKIRGKPVFRGTLDNLLELKWIKPAGRRESPGRPVTWVTDIEFLKHFGLSSIKDLPKVDELESIIM
jgi:segregation and condensation protein B